MSLLPLFHPLPNTCPATGLTAPCLMGPFSLGYPRLWQTNGQLINGIPLIEQTDETLKIHINMQQFSPQEINVRLVGDGVVIEGKREEKKDDKDLLEQHFKYQYRLPGNVDTAGLASHFSSDGILTISAPKKAREQIESRDIQVVLTNEPAAIPQATTSQEQARLENSHEKQSQPTKNTKNKT